MKTYLVYNTKTLEIIDSFDFYGKSLERCLHAYADSFWLNITHPKHVELLKKIKTKNNL